MRVSRLSLFMCVLWSACLAEPPPPPDTSLDPVASAACQASADALATELYAAPGVCSVIVRLDYETQTVIGYQVVCGPYATVSEPEARATAQADTGYGQGADDRMLDVSDAFVFHRPPADFGGAAVVSAASGLSLFGGSVVWSGTGEITYPQTWRPAAELAAGCPSAGSIASRSGYDLHLGRDLDASEVEAAMAVVTQTAVPAAFRKEGYVFGAQVFLYPRQVGVLDPTLAEWIVIVNGGVFE